MQCFCKDKLLKGAVLRLQPCYVCGVFSSRITRYNDFKLSFYILFSFVPRLAWLCHGLNVIKLCDNCFKTAYSGRSFCQSLFMFTCYFWNWFFRWPDVLFDAVLIGIKKVFFSPHVCHDATSTQLTVKNKIVLIDFMKIKVFKTILIAD